MLGDIHFSYSGERRARSEQERNLTLCCFCCRSFSQTCSVDSLWDHAASSSTTVVISALGGGGGGVFLGRLFCAREALDATRQDDTVAAKAAASGSAAIARGGACKSGVA